MATRPVLAELTELYRAHSPGEVAIESVGGVDAAKRVQAGEAFDVVILASDAIDKLVAGGRVIADFLGTPHIDFTVPSLTGLGDRQFASVKDLQNEVGSARIWGGIHYRSAVDDGVEIGTRVARQVLHNHFQESKH